MNIAITGGTGFIGKAVAKLLLSEGHHVYILTRHIPTQLPLKNATYVEWLREGSYPENELPVIDAFIHLAGESINSGRWTDEQKKRILNSRIHSTQEVRRIIESMPKKPWVVIQASAIGFYPPSDSKTYTEIHAEPGNHFLAKTIQLWEQEGRKIADLNIRTVFARFGVLLGKNEGALPRIALPYKMFIGGKVGSGTQWMSWIHIEDAARAIAFVLQHEDIHGPVNFTAPHPVRMDEFGRTLATVLKRPHWLPAPAFALKLVLGEMSDLVLTGQKVIPNTLVSHGFTFKYPSLKEALEDIYHEKKSAQSIS
ncbi:TIGR01777 family oxidoreductase [Aeribacillus pallidus]|uniref:TIGR01777 family oxidoreductase n=1 Tax=Aeribacillus pallidus TaxID=33936 RepID=UPI003D25CED8